MIGRTISHYRVVSELGSGGMGVVYEAEDTRLGRHVALKLLPLEACCDPQAMDRFLREARIISSLSHPHICTLHDIGEHDGQQFMVMELLEGESLRARIARGPLTLHEVLDLGTQVADALDAAHSAGVIHRDIKPANLFITRRGHAKVLDFGVAKLATADPAGRADLSRTVAASELTTIGSAVGTIAYMSPEQARGQEIDARSDLFSLGLVLYEMASGRQAFAGTTPAVIFEGILTRTPEPPSHANANVPAELDRIIGKALEKDRETRYQTAAEVRADLKRLIRETESGGVGVASGSHPAAATAAPAPATRLARSSANRAVLVAAPLVTIAVVAGLFFWQSQRTPALASRDTVVLADFRNRTGDAVFDDTLSEALAVQLRQSPFLNLLPDQQVQATLALMGRTAPEPLTPELGREVCQRTGAKAMLGGTIASLGSAYVLTLSAQNCVTGEVLVEEQVQAEAKEGVVTALGNAASRLREKLGESLSMVQRYDQAIEAATTPSLDALKAYSQGMTARRTQGDFESVPYFRRAIQLDPEFALAHGRLGTVLSNIGERADAERAATRAFELRDKVSERERLYIEARYHSTVTRNLAKAVEAYRLLLATYPDDYAAHSNLGSIYRDLGNQTDAVAHLEEAVRLAPAQPIGRSNLGSAYLAERRFDEARRQFEEVLKLQESVGARSGLYVIATLTGDQALADAQIAAAKGQRDEGDLVVTRAQAAAFRGQMKDADRLMEEVFRLGQGANRLPHLGESFLGLALAQALTGNPDAARAWFARIERHDMIRDGATDEVVALAAVLGDAALARPYLGRAVTHVTQVALADRATLGERGVRALEALAGGRNQEAYDHAIAAASDPSLAEHSFVAGMAALRLERWDDAVAAFDRVAAQRGKLGLSPLLPVARVMVARAHAGAGRTAAARQAYADAFAMWEHADADLPLLVAARAEHARLGS